MHKTQEEWRAMSDALLKQFQEDSKRRTEIKLRMGLSTRVLNCLLNSGLPDDFTPEDVSKLSAAELLRTPNFGRRSLKEVQVWLEHHGFDMYEPYYPPNPKVIASYVKFLRMHGWTVTPPEEGQSNDVG